MKQWPLVCGLFLLTGCSAQSDSEAEAEPESEQETQPTEDLRQYAHGVSIVGNSVLWSEKTDEEREDNSWTHNIYKKEIGETDVDTLVDDPEAQEPVSASATDETTSITYEDGYDSENNVSQRFKLYDDDWEMIYESTLLDGGHSGHVASTDEHHVIFWSNGWVNGGGVNELGTGEEVLVSAISNDGDVLHEVNLSPASERVSWPMLAASDDNALLVWQHFNDEATEAALYFAIYDPETNTVTSDSAELVPQVEFYTYSVSYVPEAEQYVVAAQTDEGAVLMLLSKEGEILDEIDAPTLVREAEPAIQENTLVFPQMPSDYFTVEIEDDQLEMQSSESLDIEWGSTGTAGTFLDDGTVYFGTLDEIGLQELFLEIDQEEE